MNFLQRAQTSFISWMQQVPLPFTEACPEFQPWHHFDPGPRSKKHEREVNKRRMSITTSTSDMEHRRNIFPKPRSRYRNHQIHYKPGPPVDVIFFQEVSKSALQQILGDSRIRLSWISSERDDTAWGKQSFATLTLMSKARFTPNTGSGMNSASLGPIWRARCPSRFDRDALCCDIFVPSSSDSKLGSKPSSTRVRLINVHLDSLPIQPFFRPRQISIISSYIHSAGCGVVAGDFNPVLEEDNLLIDKNHLTDAWGILRPEDPGYTWGVDGDQPFPPYRLDKVAVVGLTPSSIETLQPGRLGTLDSGSQQAESPEDVPWSDHHGLLCSIKS
ncbi:hypothetical protein N7452_000641 [Penicillium brevicompactum]|uniref:Endonuclease/exonuclease/phosphatase domain-containing protein n=1 Tax=Penicillium brevicompactum TaxID=5074 RepID=A0A9W9R0U2_PENBR|nr:hypothetical protein N7452_000641 [Penicillium brevicompactum]